jgi:hypothetical protein
MTQPQTRFGNVDTCLIEECGAVNWFRYQDGRIAYYDCKGNKFVTAEQVLKILEIEHGKH